MLKAVIFIGVCFIKVILGYNASQGGL